jgi:hypothetical protein
MLRRGLCSLDDLKALKEKEHNTSLDAPLISPSEVTSSLDDLMLDLATIDAFTNFNSASSF